MYQFKNALWAIFALAIIALNTSCSKDDDLFEPLQELEALTQICSDRVVLAAEYAGNPVGTIVDITEASMVVGTRVLEVSNEKDPNTGFFVEDETTVIFEFAGGSDDFRLRLSNTTGEALILTCEEELGTGDVHDITGFSSAIGALPCGTKTLQTDVQTPAGNVLAGATVTTSQSGIDVGGQFTYIFQPDGGEPAYVLVNGQPFQLLFETAPTNQIRIICPVPTGQLPNQVSQLLLAQANIAGCNSLQLEQQLQTQSGMAPAGTPVIITANTVIVVGFFSYAIDPINGVSTDFALSTGLYEIPLENGPGGQVRLECDGGVTMLPNEVQQLVDAQAATSNCMELELVTPMPTQNGIAPVGTLITITQSNVEVEGYFIFNINDDAANGTLVEFGFDGVTYNIPLEDADANLQILLECVQVPTLTNQIQDLQNALNCDLVFLGTAYQSAQAGTEVLLFNDEIILMNNQTLVIDSLNGEEVLFVTNQGSFIVPIAGAAANTQIFLECEQAVSLPVVGFFHNTYSNLVNDLGGASTNSANAGSMKVFLSNGKVFLDNQCSERYTIPSEGIDYPMEFNVEIINNEIVEYGFKVDDGNIVTQHWYEHPTGQLVNLFFGSNHTSRYSNNPPGTPDANSTIVVELTCN